MHVCTAAMSQVIKEVLELPNISPKTIHSIRRRLNFSYLPDHKVSFQHFTEGALRRICCQICSSRRVLDENHVQGLKFLYIERATVLKNDQIHNQTGNF
jgi:hypothetical protein